MHTLGKVFLALIVVFLIPAAVLLTARLINTRNHWMSQISAEDANLARSTQEIAEKELEEKRLFSQLAMNRLSWDTVFVADRSGVDQNGILTVGIGPQQGFGIQAEGQPSPIIHAFMPQADGKSVYAGPYQVESAQGNQTRLKPMFRVRPEEVANWTQGAWRLWQVIPSHAPSRVVELTNELVMAHEALTARQATLELQKKAVAQAEAALAARNQELMGNPNATPIEGRPEDSMGYVAAIQVAEAERAKELAELDRLRHAVEDAYEKLTVVLDENRKRVGQETQQSRANTNQELGLSSAR